MIMTDKILQESNIIELKASLNEKLEKEVVGFLNYREGGDIYIGVDDYGNPVDLDDPSVFQLSSHYLVVSFRYPDDAAVQVNGQNTVQVDEETIQVNGQNTVQVDTGTIQVKTREESDE